jgi:riboflavin synthase
MFTGIIEALGTVTTVEMKGTNKTLWIASPISASLKVDQSLSHDGVCLTVEAIDDGTHQVTAVKETLEKSNLCQLRAGDTINLERCLTMNGRLDGHIVQGHVDGTGVLVSKESLEGSWELTFSFEPEFAALVIEKGSISLNGVSLTVFNVSDSKFSVAIIPYTYEHTNINRLRPGNRVNLEFDMIGKYIQRNIMLSKQS